MPSILEAGQTEVAKAVAATPNSFTIGAFSDGRAITGQLTFDRKWSNGWGMTAYAKAWWHDASVTPAASSGVGAGVSVTKDF